MKHPILVSGLLSLWVGLAFSASTPPDAINYQGVLRDSNDKPLAGTYSMIFRFFSAQSGGDEILVDTHGTVSVTGGLFNVQLGNGTVSDGVGPGDYTSLAQVFRDHSEVYLEVEVAGEPLSPRIQVLSSATALNSQYVKGQDLVSTGPLDLYVDVSHSSANDANDCRIDTAPCETIQGAIDKIPVMLGGHITVHVVDGTYAGEILVADRIAPGGHQITIQGEPSATISNADVQTYGIRISRIPEIVLSNLNVRQFTGIGVHLLSTTARIHSCEITNNGNHGLAVGNAFLLELDNSTLEDNTVQGIDCRDGLIRIGPGVLIDSNGSAGIYAETCKVEFAGSSTIDSNLNSGLFAAEAGKIDFKNRTDVAVCNNLPNDLRADTHGWVRGYGSASICGDCAPSTHGECEP